MPADIQLPTFLETLLDSCPEAGSGVNPWLYQVAKQLHAHLDEPSMFSLLKDKTRECGRVVSDKEIKRQIECARGTAWRPKDPQSYAKVWGESHAEDSAEIRLTPKVPLWPEADLEAIREVVSSGWSLYDLWESSPCRLQTPGSQTEEIIDVLFPGDPLLCCGLTKSDFANRRRKVWRGHLARLAYITPNPCYKVEGLTQDGKPSQHCLEATAARVYLTVEFDFSRYARDGKTLTKWAALIDEWTAAGISVADACAGLHLHLSERLPLVMATHSGGKSLHGWYPAYNQTESQLRQFFALAVTLGADKQLWCRSQFSRMPDGQRENGQRQICYYLNPGKAVKDDKSKLC